MATTPIMIPFLPLILALGLANQGTDPPTKREPLGRHLRQLEGLPTVSGLAMNDGGDLWVLEQQPGRLLRIDTNGARHEIATGLGRPMDVELGERGELFVTDRAGGLVIHLNAGGKVLARWGEDHLVNPHGLAWNNGRIFVTDTGSHRVEMFNATGKWLGGFGGHGSGPQQLISPTDVALDGDGNLYVSDRGNSRVQVFDPKGRFLHGFGDWGPFPGLLFEPSGIEVRGQEVYVSDFGNHRVQVFDLQGELLDRFGLHAIRPREGQGYIHYPAALALSPSGEFAALAEPLVDRVQVFCRTGGVAEDAVRRQAVQLAKPSAHFGMDLTSAGPYLFVTEPEGHGVVVFENTGDMPRLISRLGGLGQHTGLLTGVAGMHFDRRTRELWVCDPVLRRVSMFRLGGSEADEVGFDGLMGRFVKSIDLAVLWQLHLTGRLDAVPEAIALDVDGEGRLYLLDRRNRAVIVLAPDLSPLETFGTAVLSEPRGLAVAADGKTVFVSDGAGVLHRFDGPERLHRALIEGFAPHGIALDEERGFLFVTDPLRHLLLRFGLDGKLQGSWGGRGLKRGEFYKPRGVTLDHRGHVIVMDFGNHRMVRVTADGEYQAVWGPRLYTRLARYPNLAVESNPGEQDE